MADQSPIDSDPSAPRRGSILFSVLISTLALAALVVMANYLAARHPARFFWSGQTHIKVSPQSAGLLRSITNHVNVIVYYNRQHEPLYSSICTLLEEYHLINPGITWEKVDYVRNPAAALRVKSTYQLPAADEKDFVIFDCEGHSRQIVPGNAFGDFSGRLIANKDGEREWERTLKAFKGDLIFSSMILAVTNPKALTACFLEDDGEHPSGGTGKLGYQRFKEVLQQSWVRCSTNSLLGTNILSPKDWNLVIIAGPLIPLHPEAIQKLRLYLNQGGRLLVLFHPDTRGVNTGLESLLAEWGIHVTDYLIVDKEHSIGPHGLDLAIKEFANHPAVNQMAGLGLYLQVPRPISKLKIANPSPDAAKVDELAFASERAHLDTNSVPFGHPIPLMAAAERAGVKGDLPDRGFTRVLAVGESLFLDNGFIEEAGNREFARCAVNWLLDQTQLLQGVGPQAVNEYKLMMTRGQFYHVRWIFLAGLPGSILLLGGLVWLRRRI